MLHDVFNFNAWCLLGVTFVHNMFLSSVFGSCCLFSLEFGMFVVLSFGQKKCTRLFSRNKPQTLELRKKYNTNPENQFAVSANVLTNSVQKLFGEVKCHFG